jgi:hypothetical protein
MSGLKFGASYSTGLDSLEDGSSRLVSLHPHINLSWGGGGGGGRPPPPREIDVRVEWNKAGRTVFQTV